MKKKIALIIYGDGKELGDFKIFANSLKKELGKKYDKIIIQHVNRDFEFFKLLLSINHAKEEIAELHIFSHSIGAGLFLGYHDPAIARNRESILRRLRLANKKINYGQAVFVEKGAIQTDDFYNPKITNSKLDYQKKFSNKAFIKIWGCNSGVKHWVYSDNGVTDPNDTSEAYYWRAFNTKNTPKPSIAQALATFFNCKVYGALSGSSIIVKHKKKWISSAQYKNRIGHWPSGQLPHRLIPDKGDYNEFLP